MILHVESITGTTGLLEPCAFMLGDQRLKVVAILDRWIATRHAYFKLKANDGDIYILRYDEDLAQWEMTLFQAARE
jgi:hypothetical protein